MNLVAMATAASTMLIMSFYFHLFSTLSTFVRIVWAKETDSTCYTCFSHTKNGQTSPIYLAFYTGFSKAPDMSIMYISTTPPITSRAVTIPISAKIMVFSAKIDFLLSMVFASKTLLDMAME